MFGVSLTHRPGREGLFADEDSSAKIHPSCQNDSFCVIACSVACEDSRDAAAICAKLDDFVLVNVKVSPFGEELAIIARIECWVALCSECPDSGSL